MPKVFRRQFCKVSTSVVSAVSVLECSKYLEKSTIGSLVVLIVPSSRMHPTYLL